MKLTILTLCVVFSTMSGAYSASTCWGRCQDRPSLADYMHPFGCYCHSTCGGSLPCCYDKSKYCGGSSGSGGSQACMLPSKVSNADIVGGQKLFYAQGETITYKCRRNYVMKGSATRTCLGLSVGVWSPRPPTCSYSWRG